MSACIYAMALLTILASPPPNPPVDRPAPAAPQASPLRPLLDGIRKDAEIATDGDDTAAGRPRDIRDLLGNWPPPVNPRGNQRISLLIREGRIALTGGMEFGTGEEAQAASQIFSAALGKSGYQLLKDEERKAFLAGPESRFQTRRAVVRRQAGETELFVSFEAMPYTGSSTYRSGVQFSWLARRPFPGNPPTLAEALAALPQSMKAPFLDEKFYSALADEPVQALSSQAGFGVEFARPISAKIVAALEKTGFEYQSEAPSTSRGDTQKTWYRFTDITYAHVIQPADGKTTRFSCQTPQHQGAPIAVKPPPLHPSLRLPYEKRPVLTLDQLKFADGELQRKAKLFHDMGEKLAQKNWAIEHFKDVRYSADPRFVASWQSSAVTSTHYIPKVRPYQGISLAVQGKQADGADLLNGLGVSGVFAPADGWGAMVSYTVHTAPDGKTSWHLGATAALARKESIFALSGEQSVSLTSRWVSGWANESKAARYQFQAQLPEVDLAKAFRTLYGTPETLRDGVLADIEALRKKAREQLELGNSTAYYDMSDVRSDNPPRQAPAAIRPPAAATKQALWAEVQRQLEAQEKTIWENFREIHAAIQQALPLQDLKEQLISP